jgi:hypothetical protein
MSQNEFRTKYKESKGWKRKKEKCFPRSQDDASKKILIAFNKFSIVHPRSIVMHDSLAFLKSCESMAFLIRDVAHITPLNFGRCVQVRQVVSRI